MIFKDQLENGASVKIPKFFTKNATYLIHYKHLLIRYEVKEVINQRSIYYALLYLNCSVENAAGKNCDMLCSVVLILVLRGFHWFPTMS